MDKGEFSRNDLETVLLELSMAYCDKDTPVSSVLRQAQYTTSALNDISNPKLLY